RNATIQRLVAGARSDGTLTALGGDFVASIGWDGWLASTAGPMQMLYACENVRTVEYGAKLNTPPMKAFRAPGFVEGTFGLECLLDELAAKLDLDPLEVRRRNHADEDLVDGRPFSSKNLVECYRRAEKYWARRDEVRARSAGPWKRGVRRRGAPDPRARGAALPGRGARPLAARRPHRLVERRFLADPRDHRPPRGRADPGAGEPRAEPDRHAGADVRRPGGRGRRRR